MDEPSSIGDHVLHSFFDSYKLSSRALVQNLPLLNRLYVSILVSIALHISLFYWQIWKQFIDNEEKEEMEREKEKEGEEETELKENQLQQTEAVEEMTTVSSYL